MKPGTFTATVTDYVISKNNKGNAQVILQFTFKDEEGMQQNLVWYGQLNEGKSREITIDSLLTCGYKFDDLDGLVQPNAFDGREVNIVVDMEQDQQGKTRPKIKFINRHGVTNFRNALKGEEALALIRPLNLGGLFKQRREKTGEKPTSDPKLGF